MLPQPGPLHPSPAAVAAGMEEPEICYVCDKSFKSHRTLDNHMKKQHGLSAGGESAALPTLPPKAEMEKAMQVRSGQEGKREKVSFCCGAAKLPATGVLVLLAVLHVSMI